MEAIRRLREAAGMSLQEVADAVGVKQIVMASIEEGTFVPGPEVAERIAALFNQPADSIFDRNPLVNPVPLVDPYGIPEDIFGYVAPDLPASIGRIVMLAALVEARIGQLLGSLTNRPLEEITGRDAAANSKDCRAVLAAYNASAMEDRFRTKTHATLEGAEAAFATRNAIVHRVWSKAGLDEWSGWKPLRPKQRADHWLQNYKAFTPDDFTDLISALCELVRDIGAAIAEAGSYPKKV